MLKDQIRDPQEKVGLDLAARLSELVVSFSWTAAEVAALADAGYYNISEDLLNEDKEKIIELGSFQALVDYHNNNKQKDNGLSMERVYQYLADNPNYAKSEHWWTRDTTADFQPLNRTAQFETCRYESYKYIEKLRQECMLRMQDIHNYWTVLNCAPGEIPTGCVIDILISANNDPGHVYTTFSRQICQSII